MTTSPSETKSDSGTLQADDHDNDMASADAEKAKKDVATNEKDSPVDEAADPNIVDWDGPDDPANPRNWSKKKKMLNVALVSLSVLYSNIATTMFAPGAAALCAEFGITSSFIEALVVTIPSVGASMGPLLLAPLSEVLGRVHIYWASALLYIGCTVGCAFSTNAAMFLVFRFFCGACAASFMTVGGGTIADLLPKEERGGATAMFSAGPLLGPVIGPIIGGFVTQNLGWRWTFYLVLILAGSVTIVATIVMRETNANEILKAKAARLRKETGNAALWPARTKHVRLSQLMKRALVRPIRMLMFSPIVLLIALYMAITFGMTFLLFATFPSVFQHTYNWSTGVSGLAYLGLGLGCVIGLGLSAKLSDKLLKKGGGPERRLLLMIFVGPACPIGIFWYGWSAKAGIPWIVPILGTVLIGTGVLVVTTSAQLYMMDMFGPEGAASALAATTLVRNASGAFLALAAEPLYTRYGFGWGNSILGFVTLGFVPVPIFFYKYGLFLREKFPLKL